MTEELSDTIDRISKQVGISKTKTRQALQELYSTISGELEDRERIRVGRFGTFAVKKPGPAYRRAKPDAVRLLLFDETESRSPLVFIPDSISVPGKMGAVTRSRRGGRSANGQDRALKSH